MAHTPGPWTASVAPFLQDGGETRDERHEAQVAAVASYERWLEQHAAELAEAHVADAPYGPDGWEQIG